jgi:hypothetical protein
LVKYVSNFYVAPQPWGVGAGMKYNGPIQHQLKKIVSLFASCFYVLLFCFVVVFVVFVPITFFI